MMIVTRPKYFISSICILLVCLTGLVAPKASVASYITMEKCDLKELGAEEGLARLEKKHEQGHHPELRKEAPFPLGEKDIQMITNVVGSHLGIIVRPLSSLNRLAFLAIDTGFEVVKQGLPQYLPDAEPPPLWDGPGMDLERWEVYLGEITNTQSSSGSLKYLVDGEEYFSALKDAVVSAKKSVYIRSYIFDNDDFAREIGDLLKQRSESIDIRVLLDGLGTILATRTTAPTIPTDYKAPGSVRSYLTKDTRLRVRQQTNPWMAGDHSKTTIVDGRLAFVGGMNIGREYRYEWHDLMMKVKGPVVDELRNEFMGAWRHAGVMGDLGKLLYSLKPKKKTAGDINGETYPVRILRTRPGDPDIFRAQLAAIKKAKKYIYIQSPYLSDDIIIHELTRARHRGVDVRVVLPGENENGLMQMNNLAAARILMKQKVRVYLYPGMTHVKAAVYDGWACLGSANMDKLSFRVNREINLSTSNPSAVEGLVKRLFLPDFAKSVELSEPPPRKWNAFFVEALADHL